MHVYLGSLGRAKKGDHMVQTDSGEPGGDDWGWHLITIAGVCLLALAVFLMYRGETSSEPTQRPPAESLDQ